MIIAYDNAGNKAQQNNGENYYIYTGIPELQTTHALLALILTTTIMVVLIKKVKIEAKFLTTFAMEKRIS